MYLLLDDLLPTRPYPVESAKGVVLTLSALEPADHDALVAGAKGADGKTDFPAFYAALAKRVIVGWEGLREGGEPAPCDDARKDRFGRRFAYTVMPGVLRAATDLRAFGQEVEAAKND